MGYPIRKHIVDRLLNITVALGWTLVEEVHEIHGITIKLHKDIAPELLKASGEVDFPSTPQ